MMGKVTLGIAALVTAIAPITASAAQGDAPQSATTDEGEAIGGEYGLVISVILLAAVIAGIAIAASGGDDGDAPVSP